MHYYGTRLSGNISRREPEEYLLCLNVPVARTGPQDYLPEELGLPSGPAVIPVLRTEKEVFSSETIASFEGMLVTNDHPPDGVDIGNIRALQKGHAYNVRRGSGAEADLLLADLIITDPVLIDLVLDGIAFGQAETDARILALDEFIAGLDRPLMLFVPAIGTAASVVADGSLLQELYARRSKRAVPFFCAAVSDAAALMGTAMDLELSHPASAFALCYKTISGIQPSDLTETEADAVKALNGNLYLTRGYTHLLLERGTVSSGARYDEVLYLDKIADELQNAAVTLLAENPDKLPQTDDSTAQFINRFTAILMNYTDRGVLASGVWRGADTGPLSAGDTVENGFVLWADSYDDQPDADRAAHKAVPVNAGLILAGSIESIVITVNVMI